MQAKTKMAAWITLDEARAFLGVRAQTIYAYVSRGLIEAHPDPDHAVSDGAQTIDFPTLDAMLVKLKAMAGLFGRVMG